MSVALVLCLNIGVDPPDVAKIQPCARLECWIDPSSVSPQKAMELIGANLQKQYERWQPRARYKKFHDPTIEDVKKLCTSLRRNAKEERVLFHYNGHGVPRPTENGEIWVFNKTYTQYIPLSIYDLQTWMGAPSIYVYDCSNAGMIVNSFNQFAETHENEMQKALNTSGNRGQSPGANVQLITYKNCIQLAACSANQILPMNHQLPADLFTSCLTTPIKIALKWYTMQRTSMLVPQINSELIEKIPGQLNDRRTMLGELNWIFTAITDTIAWNTLPRDLFQKLFRQDLLVASLFRNFLLAERILRSYDCTPVSSPPLPECFRHPMWSAWDLAVDLALQQLPDILEHGAPYKQLPFFEEQLTAFQVWLDQGTEQRSPPEQLPIVLQVLLSQVLRLRALELLGRFLDLGPWAVNLALGVGIFPYVLKLLQSSAKELRPVLVFIWAKILAVDPTCQVDLVKDHKYFLSVLQDPTVSKEHRTLAAFVLASIVNNFPLGQSSALQGSLVSICLVQIYDDNWLLRQWLTICLGQLWQNFAKARWSGVRDLAHEKLYRLLEDPWPEVRAAAVFALGTYISSVTERSEHADNIDQFIAITLLTSCGADMSPLVRLELIAALQWMVLLFLNRFVSAYLQDTSTSSGNNTYTTHSLERNIIKRVLSFSSIPFVASVTPQSGGTYPASTIGFRSIYMQLWQGIVNLGRDPYPQVADAAQKVIEYVRNHAVHLIQAKEATSEKCGASLSLPPSPNTRTNYLAEDLCELSPTLMRSSMSRGFPATRDLLAPIRGGKMDMEANIRLPLASFNDSPPKPPHIMRASPANGIHDSSFGSTQPSGQQHIIRTNPANGKFVPSGTTVPLVVTNFIPLAINYFGKTMRYARKMTYQENCTDHHSPEYQQRLLRFKQNYHIRTLARDQQMRAIFNRIDTQNWFAKTQFTPSIVKLLPYDNQIAVAYKEKVSVHDWNRGTAYSYTPQSLVMSSGTLCGVSSSSGKNSFNDSLNQLARVTALEFVNAHYFPLVLVGYADGTIRVWEPVSEKGDTRLITAWQGLFVCSKSNKDPTGIVTTWHQKSQHLCIGGNNRFMRIWDIETEMRLYDIPTGSESSVRVLSSSPNETMAAGFSDGSIRLFDKRCSQQSARVMTYREHQAPILAACLRESNESLVSGCTQGKVRLYDVRGRASSIHSWSVGNDVSAIAVHSSADIVACGSQCVAIYGLDGRAQSTVRHEGFMGSKIGHTSCLSFHPHKVLLAGGFVDNTVTVYGLSGNKCIV